MSYSTEVNIITQLNVKESGSGGYRIHLKRQFTL